VFACVFVRVACLSMTLCFVVFVCVTCFSSHRLLPLLAPSAAVGAVRGPPASARRERAHSQAAPTPGPFTGCCRSVPIYKKYTTPAVNSNAVRGPLVAHAVSVAFLSCRVLCCSCGVFVCVTCFSSQAAPAHGPFTGCPRSWPSAAVGG